MSCWPHHKVVVYFDRRYFSYDGIFDMGELVIFLVSPAIIVLLAAIIIRSNVIVLLMISYLYYYGCVN